MRKYTRHIMIGLTAALMLAAAVGTSSARNLSTTEQSFRVTWSPLTFTGAGAIEARCNVTLEGSFDTRTIAKVERSVIGHITRAITARPCARNTAWIYNGTERNEVLGNTTLPTSLPWSLTYESFRGTLPRIETINLLLTGARFLLRATILGAPLLCDYTTGATNGNATGIAAIGAGGRIESLAADGARRIRSESGGFCPEGSFGGTGPVTGLNAGNSISITLI